MSKVVSVSTIDELVVVKLVIPGTAELVVEPNVVELVVVAVLQYVVVTVVIDVVTAEVRVVVDIVVVMVGPSGCLRRPILLAPNSVNHTFNVSPVLV